MLIYISEELAEEVKQTSKGLGKSSGRLVEEAVTLTLNALKLGYSPEKALEVLNAIQAQRALGGAFIPQDALNIMTENLDKSEKEQLQTKLYEAGKAHGKFLKEKFEDPLPALKTFLETTRWDLNEVEVKREAKTIKLRCTSTAHTAEATELLTKFIEGLINGLEYTIQKIDWIKGIIIAEFL
jgi:predicted hydrocarbon binding protein